MSRCQYESFPEAFLRMLLCSCVERVAYLQTTGVNHNGRFDQLETTQSLVL